MFARSILTLLASATIAAPIASASHIPVTAPLEQAKSHQSTAAKSKGSTKVAAHKKKWSRLTAAAICTEDLATIKFQEYPADWSAWLDQVSNCWTQSIEGINGSGFRPSSPLFVEFTCNRDGTISEIVIDRSSGDKACDQVQIKGLLQALPLPAFPPESRKQSVTLLCIWSYANQTTIAKRSKPKQEPRAVTRMSMTGMTL